jgi:hypothetical protein
LAAPYFFRFRYSPTFFTDEEPVARTAPASASGLGGLHFVAGEIALAHMLGKFLSTIAH